MTFSSARCVDVKCTSHYDGHQSVKLRWQASQEPVREILFINVVPQSP